MLVSRGHRRSTFRNIMVGETFVLRLRMCGPQGREVALYAGTDYVEAWQVGVIQYLPLNKLYCDECIQPAH